MEKLILLYFLFFVLSDNTFSQTKIEIRNTDIDDLSLISMSFENDSIVKALEFKTVDKFLLIENGYSGKIRLSHIGFYDTTVVISSANENHVVMLRPYVAELKEIIVREPKLLTVKERKNRGNHNMLFALEENSIWYFEIDLSVLEAKRLHELSIALENVDIKNSLEVTIFKTIHDAAKDNLIYRDTIPLSSIKNNFITVYNYKNNPTIPEDHFVLALKMIPLISTNSGKKGIASVVTAFREKGTNIYLQSERRIINKMPNEHYFRYFKSYPYLIKMIKYEK